MIKNIIENAKVKFVNFLLYYKFTKFLKKQNEEKKT